MTDFLYARPSFWEGFGRVIDFGGTLTEFNNSQTHADADRRALQADWAAVAGDMMDAIKIVTTEANGQSPAETRGRTDAQWRHRPVRDWCTANAPKR